MAKIRLFIIQLLILSATLTAAQKNNQLIINADLGTETISKYIYGHFAEHLGNCIYGGFWVGEDSPIPNTRGIRNDVINALKEIDPPVIRWPGGCFADYYHWKDGIGPREKRPAIINSTWGGVSEDNSFGTHEFLDLCELLGTEAYICVNMGSGTVQEAADWVEYVNSDTKSPMTDLRKKNGRDKPWNVKFWAVGNESWGCGGNMSPEYYTDLYKRYTTYMRAGHLYKVASGGTSHDYHWTETVLEKTRHYRQLIQGYAFHYYTVCHGWNNKGSATQFDEDDWFHTMNNTLVMEEHLDNNIALMDEYDPDNTIGLMADEWGNWYDVEPGTNPAFLYQQNTLRDAVTAALYLNIYNNHARRVKMANIAQTINVLQAMLLTKKDMIVKTPTFYVFKMYKVHQGATLLPVHLKCEEYKYNEMVLPAVSASASRDKKGKIHISLANINPKKDISIEVEIRGSGNRFDVKGEIITAPSMNDYNDFGRPEKVNLQPYNDFTVSKNSIIVKLPAKSVVTVTVNE